MVLKRIMVISSLPVWIAEFQLRRVRVSILSGSRLNREPPESDSQIMQITPDFWDPDGRQFARQTTRVAMPHKTHSHSRTKGAEFEEYPKALPKGGPVKLR